MAYRILTRNKHKLKRLAALLASQTETAMKPEPEYTLKVSVAERAVLLEKHLTTLAQDHPDRERLIKILVCLRRGEEPPGEGVQTSQQPKGGK